jgi:hypothetical protein
LKIVFVTFSLKTLPNRTQNFSQNSDFESCYSWIFFFGISYVTSSDSKLRYYTLCIWNFHILSNISWSGEIFTAISFVFVEMWWMLKVFTFFERPCTSRICRFESFCSHNISWVLAALQKRKNTTITAKIYSLYFEWRSTSVKHQSFENSFAIACKNYIKAHETLRYSLLPQLQPKTPFTARNDSFLVWLFQMSVFSSSQQVLSNLFAMRNCSPKFLYCNIFD